MSDIKQQLWEWQESIDSSVMEKLLLVQTLIYIGKLEKVAEAAKILAPIVARSTIEWLALDAALKELEAM